MSHLVLFHYSGTFAAMEEKLLPFAGDSCDCLFVLERDYFHIEHFKTTALAPDKNMNTQ